MDNSHQYFHCRAVLKNSLGTKNIMFQMEKFNCDYSHLLEMLHSGWRNNYPVEIYWKDADGDRFDIKNDGDFRCFTQIGNHKVFAEFAN